jgi:hypothetical protein
MRVGELWQGKCNEPGMEDVRWLYLIVARVRRGRKVRYVAIKCDWDTRRPLLESISLHLFDSNGKEADWTPFPYKFWLTWRIA